MYKSRPEQIRPENRKFRTWLLKTDDQKLKTAEEKQKKKTEHKTMTNCFS